MRPGPSPKILKVQFFLVARICIGLVEVKWFGSDFGFKCKQESWFCRGHTWRALQSLLCRESEAILHLHAEREATQQKEKPALRGCYLVSTGDAQLATKSLRTATAICFQERDQQPRSHSQGWCTRTPRESGACTSWWWRHKDAWNKIPAWRL